MIDDSQLCVRDEEMKSYFFSSIDCHRFCPICGEDLRPERSKREDFCIDNLVNEYMEEMNNNSVYDFANWLNKRCGALNTMET